MAVTQIADVVVPAEFTAYIVAQSLVNTALFQSDVLVKNGEIESQLSLGSNNFNIPYWIDPADGAEADVTSDDPAVLSVPLKVTAGKQAVHKSFLHKSWGEMSLASELSGSDALALVQKRVSAYWDRQFQARLIASLRGVLLSNVANNSADMVVDISGGTGDAADFNSEAVINTALTLGDRLGDVKSIAVHSAIYGAMLKSNEVQFFKPSENAIEIPTYKGMSIVISDSLSPVAGVYSSILMGAGAVGFAVTPPRIGPGTEIWRQPDSGNGGGATTLHSRTNSAIHPLGYSFTAASVAGESPTVAELATAANWTRQTGRKSIPLAFLVSKVAA